MKTLNPNCSEVVFRLKNRTIKTAIKQLKKIGITRKTLKDFWDSGSKITLLVDKDNPDTPDYKNKSYFELRRLSSLDAWEYKGIYIMGSQHCQSQLFPTMLKIEKALGDFEDWKGYDGGSIVDYEDWKLRKEG